MIENELEKQMSKTAHWIKVQGRPHHARCSKCNKVTAYAWGGWIIVRGVGTEWR